VENGYGRKRMKISVYKSELEEILKQLEYNYNSGISNSKKIINNILATNEPNISIKDEVSELFLDYILTHTKPMYYCSTNPGTAIPSEVWRFPDDRDFFERAKKLKNLLGK
jgi:uncharacterized protein (DUF2164 family)